MTACHMPSVIYGTCLKLSYIAACLILCYKAYRNFTNCIGDHRVWQAVRLILNILSAFHLIVLCIEMLSKRREFTVLFGAFLQYRREFPHEICFYKAKLRTYLMISLIITSVFYKVPYGFKYAFTQPNYCDYDATTVNLVSTSLFLLWCSTLSIECCMLGGFLTGYILMDQLVVQCQHIFKEISLLQCSQLSLRKKNKWNEMINQSLQQLLSQQRMISLLEQKLTDNCIWTLMVSIFNRSIQLICIMAYHVLLLERKGRYMEKFINCGFALALTCSLAQMFFLSQNMAQKYLLLVNICYKTACKMKRARNKMELILQNSLDTLIVELRQNHFRIRFLHLFNVDLATFFVIIGCCINQLLVLLQQVIQYNIDEHKDYIRDRKKSLQKIHEVFKKWDASIDQDNT